MKHQPELICFRYQPFVVGARYKWESPFAYTDKDYATKIAFEKAQDRRRKCSDRIYSEGVKIIQCERI